MYLKESGVRAQILLIILGSIVSINGGGLLGCFMALTLLTLKNLSSNRGAQKFPYLVAKTHITFVDPRMILTLISKLRIIANSRNLTI
jgi:hypothetical protein